MTDQIVLDKGARIAKVMARSGLCSRRDAEKLILAQKVKLNGQLVLTPATNVQDTDNITVDGVPLPYKVRARLWRFYKPAGVMTTHKDPQGRPTLFDMLPAHLPRMMSIGRLDLMSEGLILLTNDGDLARLMELPSTRLERTYHIRLFGIVDPKLLEKLKKGITIDNIYYDSLHARVMLQQNSNCWVQVTIREGKNRELRRIFTHLGYRVNRLIRQQYGPFDLENLESGQIKEIPSEVLHQFLSSDLKLNDKFQL